MQLTLEQKWARTSALLELREPLTEEELYALDNSLYPDWPQSLKDKTGQMGLLVRNEDALSQAASSKEN